jgi:threonine aldolase
MAGRIVDLRSDAITTPTDAMWEAMRSAELGWASAGQDPTVRELENEAARLAGKEAALYVLTGGMANLVALMTHTERGDQILLDSWSHILWCEEWSFAYIAGLTHRALDGHRGQPTPSGVADAMAESLYRHRPNTSLLCLENTDNMYSEAATPQQVHELSDVARELGLATHLDGARVLSACVALDVGLDEMLSPVDSAMVSLNKGLSAPGGALLVGTAAFINKAKLNVRRLGGSSFHQAGIHAAAGLVALREMIPQLAEDNRRAALLARSLQEIEGITLDRGDAPTNMVIAELAADLMPAQTFVDALAEHGVLAYVSRERSVRFVTHRHIDDDEIAWAVAAVASVVGEAQARAEGVSAS